MISNVIKPTISLVKLAHQLIKDKVNPGAVAIDATVGNGYDTRFLLDLVQPDGKVFGFDIQQAAIDSARITLQEHPALACLTLIHANHANMGTIVSDLDRGNIAAVMFNLGYLPGGDKRLVTQTETTMAALTSASALLSANGIITILAYPGHDGGAMETDHVKQWCLGIESEHYQVSRYENQPDNPAAPKLFVVNKIG